MTITVQTFNLYTVALNEIYIVNLNAQNAIPISCVIKTDIIRHLCYAFYGMSTMMSFNRQVIAIVQFKLIAFRVGNLVNLM